MSSGDLCDDARGIITRFSACFGLFLVVVIAGCGSYCKSGDDRPVRTRVSGIYGRAGRSNELASGVPAAERPGQPTIAPSSSPSPLSHSGNAITSVSPGGLFLVVGLCRWVQHDDVVGVTCFPDTVIQSHRKQPEQIR